MLKARLARALGDEIAAEHPEHGVASAAVKELQAEGEQLLAARVELRRQLRSREEVLEDGRVALRLLPVRALSALNATTRELTAWLVWHCVE